MVSILAQERLLGAALGAIFTGVVVFEQRRSIYSLISQNQPQIEVQKEGKEPKLGELDSLGWRYSKKWEFSAHSYF
ncbi:uncharacterized protein LOC131245965 isoform X2 [Magnolia sinica]|uniref:uncharacterized protein LOC131245965 isoform X2 n=1 Tax=Magnolia sinica TaxID=86752 RepID=UPI00265A01CC|nr:uncharacterized protein LOC131245965 isoform X2 [Magnolia sinica]